MLNTDQVWSDPSPVLEVCKAYRIVTPWDYAVQADLYLRTWNYATRLVEVCTPGLISYRVCYMPDEGGYLDYDPQTQKFFLTPSSPAIRDVAAKVADSHSANWSYAAEFTFSDGLKRSIATVVKTDPPGSDPAPMGSKGGIKIDF